MVIIHEINTQKNSRNSTLACRSKEQSQHYQTAKVYDFLPNRVRNIESYDFFKNLLKALLITKEYYSIRKYFSYKISENDDFMLFVINLFFINMSYIYMKVMI
jgi:hypothetical protein